MIMAMINVYNEDKRHSDDTWVSWRHKLLFNKLFGIEIKKTWTLRFNFHYEMFDAISARGPFLLTWISFNSSMDKLPHAP